MSVPDHIKQDEALMTVWAAMQRIAPLSLADTSWDNVGVLLQAPSPQQNKGKRVMLAIDLTTDVVDEALEDGQIAVLIVYHPVIFRAIKSITLENSQQRSLLRLAAANISIYTPHTSLDACDGGINDWLIEVCTAEEDISAIEPSKNPPSGQNNCGFGRIVKLSQSNVSVVELVERVKMGINLKHVQVACPASLDPHKRLISSIAVCAGSGSSILNGVKADAYLTGEMSHHEVLACVAQGIVVILTNHSNSERGYLRSILQHQLQNTIKEIGKDYTVCVSKRDRDPLETW